MSMHITRRLIVLLLLLCVAGGVSFLFCTYPADSTGRELIEIERVWQYMKAYSLYAAQVPSHAEALRQNDPASLVGKLRADTLRSHYDTSAITIAHYSPYCISSNAHSSNTSPAKRGIAGLYQAGSIRYTPLTEHSAYVVIDSFVSGTDDSLRAVGSLLASYDNVILDLRYNPGGSLDACTASVELFLPANISYLYATYRRDVRNTGDTGTVVNDLWTSGYSGDVWEGRRIVVLIGPYTASAAEILVVALRDGLGSNWVRVIGQTSYGKAIGQFRFCFWSTSGGQLILTGFRFLPIGGAAADYHERGIEPDVQMPADSLLTLLLAAGSMLEQDFEQNLSLPLRALFAALPKAPAQHRALGYRDIYTDDSSLF